MTFRNFACSAGSCIFFFQAEDGIRDVAVTGVQTCALPISCDKSRRKFLAKSKEWLSKHRHWKRRDQQKQLVMMLRGFYQYFGLHHCKPKLDGVRREVQRQWARTLRRRSQRHRLYWSYLLSQSWFELPYAVSTLHATV